MTIKPIISRICALATILHTAGSAWSCSCLPTSDPILSAAQADLVFVGKVQSIKTVIQRLSPRRLAELTPTEIFVGNQSALRFEIQTSASGASCGFGFSEGQEYLVYATESEGTYSTHLCTRTRSLRNAEADLPILRSLVQSSANPIPKLKLNQTYLERQLIVIGGVGRRWHLQSSLNLSDWTTVQTFEGRPLSVIMSTDAPGQEGRSFFRLQGSTE